MKLNLKTMNEARKQKLFEALEQLKDRKTQLSDIRSSVWKEYESMPEKGRFKYIRNRCSDAVDALDESEALVDGLIEDLERALVEKPQEPAPAPDVSKVVVEPAVTEDSKNKAVGCSIIIAIIFGIVFIPLGIELIKLGAQDSGGALGAFVFAMGVVFVLLPVIAFIPFSNLASGNGYTQTYSGGDDSSISSFGDKKSDISDVDQIRRDIYAKQDEDLSILEDMIQMHSANPDADLEEHYGWDHKIDYDQDGGDDAW
jgi:hypothetical protein